MPTTTPQPSESAFDLVIVGAGINGAGIARDAAMRGLNVLLLDKGDIGGGTSSSSTRLIHGGLRYLEHGEFGLVRESLRERETLLRIAPHLVKSLPLLVPIYDGARRGRWTIRAGMSLYDLLSFDKSLPRHRMLSRAETLERLPGIEPHRLKGAAVYYDAQVAFAERLVLENVLSAKQHGTTVQTYERVDRLMVEDGRVRRIETTNQITGAQNSISAHFVINAAGPWADQLFTKGVQGTSGETMRLIGGTKGSHIVVAPFAGAPSSAIYVEARTDQRPFFIIPWNDNYLIGTTDIRFDGNPDEVRINEHEVEYLLRETNRVIPSAALKRVDILYAYSGVRPLPFTSNTDEPSITRRHFIKSHAEIANLFSIVGGKLTTYRSLAEEAVDQLFLRLGKALALCVTSHTPLPGAAGLQEFLADYEFAPGVSDETIRHLLRTYGTSSAAVMKLVSADQRLGVVLDPESGAIGAEVLYAFTDELAQTLSDCLLRRTMVGLNSTCGLNALDASARIAHEGLGWSTERVQHETLAYRRTVAGLMRFS